ncbi:MAG: alanine--tRNA ligase [Myxococcota bacterium]
MSEQSSTSWTSQIVRQKFLDYFAAHVHHVVESSSLVPHHDPTLLFTAAGMVQFKDYFSGIAEAPYASAVSSQRCLRAGGKHNDLENVGFTPRHHTFFEMLGNFSFRSYFKREAIQHAWTFLTEELQLDPQRLWVSVFAGEDDIPTDEEAYTLWRDQIGIPEQRILRLGSQDNFWSAGDTGPCGPCSEILYDRGPAYDKPGETSRPDQENNRYLEIWNLVFMQFDRDANGVFHTLPRPAIDTGMGLERIVSILQDTPSNYETDLFRPIIDNIAKGVDKHYGQHPEDDVCMRVIADHARATTFLMADGVFPGNEKRAYVLRRIMRRAIRYGQKLGYEQEPFFHHVCTHVIAVMKDVYPYLSKHQKAIRAAALQEEKGFRSTLAKGLKLLEKELTQDAVQWDKTLSGEVVFKLHDTFGFPPDLTALICEEQGIHAEPMRRPKEHALQDNKHAFTAQETQRFQEAIATHGPSTFVGYTQTESTSTLLALWHDGQRVSEASAGTEVECIFDQTPFYGESGGQVGDCGTLHSTTQHIGTIVQTTKPIPDLHVHRIQLHAPIKNQMSYTLRVDPVQRQMTCAHHSATHLLHWALRKTLGDHVHQAGSLVTPERLRFDFTHYQAPTSEELQEVSAQVNAFITQNESVVTQEGSMEDAKTAGAMALFGEKYGNTVRMVRMGPSLELCGGTHVKATGELGLFHLVSEQGIQAGVRRIEAIAGQQAQYHSQQAMTQLEQLSQTLRCAPAQLSERLEKLLHQQKQQQNQIEQLQLQLAQQKSADAATTHTIRGISVLVQETQVPTPKAMRALADRLRQQLGEGILILASQQEQKAALCVMVSESLAQKGVHAGKLLQPLVGMLGGKGGGRPTMAQGGGPDTQNLPQVLRQATDLVQKHLEDCNL